jgi:hypothetical protein
MPERLAARLGLCAALAAIAAPHVALAEPKRVSEKVGERVTRGVIDESLETLDTQENKARLGRILSSQPMQSAMHDLTASIVRGVFDGVKQSAKGMDLGLADFDMAKSIGKGLDEHIGPAAGRMTGKIVDAALTASLSDKHLTQVEKLARHGTHAALAGVGSGLQGEVGPALAVTIQRDVGPAIAHIIEHDIMPSVGRGLDSPEMQAAIANTTRSIALAAVVGGDAGLDLNKEKAEARGDESGMQVFGGRVALGYAIALFVAFAFGTMLIVMTVLLVRSNRRQQRQQAAAEKRETALLAVLDRLEGDGHPASRTAARAVIRDELSDSQE